MLNHPIIRVAEIFSNVECDEMCIEERNCIWPRNNFQIMKNILKTRCESSAKKNVVDPSSNLLILMHPWLKENRKWPLSLIGEFRFYYSRWIIPRRTIRLVNLWAILYLPGRRKRLPGSTNTGIRVVEGNGERGSGKISIFSKTSLLADRIVNRSLIDQNGMSRIS